MEIVKFYSADEVLPFENEVVEVEIYEDLGRCYEAIYSDGKFHVKGARIKYKPMACCFGCDPNPYGPRETIEKFEKSYDPNEVCGFFRRV